MSSRVWVPPVRSGGSGKVRDKFCGVEASPERPQDGRGVGVGPEDFLEEEGSTRRPEEGGAGQAMMGPRRGRWAASLGLGDCTGRGGEGSGSPEVVVSVLLGVGGQRGPWGEKPQRVLCSQQELVLSPAALQPWLPTLTGYGHWELGGTKRWGHLSPSGCGWGREGRTKRWGDAGGWPCQPDVGWAEGRSRGAWARVSPGQALDESLMSWCPGAAGAGCAGRRKRRGLIKGGSQKPPGLPLPAFGAAGLVLGRGWAGSCSRRPGVCGPAWMAPGTPCDP